MHEPMKIVFIGSGAISTAIGNILAGKEKYNIQLLSIEKDVINSINRAHVNVKYFPNVRLHPALSLPILSGFLIVLIPLMLLVI